MSNDLAVRLRIEANTRQATAEVVQFGKAVGGVRNEGAAAKQGLDAVAAGANNVEKKVQGAQGAVRALAAAIGIVGARELVSQLVEAAQAAKGFEIGLGAVAGGAAGASAELAFVRDEAGRMGLDVRKAAQSFLELAGATNGTALAGQQTREIWEGVMQAGLALGRSNEQIQRGLEAISQVASKGVVSMEEIRQQLAEAIPGATNIAARAMGLSTAEFNKMVAAGKLASSDFLPKFAATLKSEFGPAVDKYLNTDIGRARVELGKLKTDLFDLSAIGGQAFLGGVVEGLSDLHRSLTDQETRDAIRELGRGLGEVAGTGAKGLAVLADNADKAAVVLGVLAGLRVGASIAAIGAEALAASEGVGVLAAAVAALGGPVTILAALAGGAAAGGLALWGASAASAAADAQQLDDHVATLEASLAESAGAGDLAAGGVQGFGAQSAAAQQLVEALTGKVGSLADEMYRVATANKSMAINKMMADVAAAQSDLDKAQKGANREILGFGAMVGGMGDWTPSVDQTSQAAGIARAQAAIEAGQARIRELRDTPLTDPKWNPPKITDAPAAASPNKGLKKADRMAGDLEADVVALHAYREALVAGGQALDDWRIKDAGRQAVEQAGLAHKAKLTEAEQTLAGRIRTSAEETERLKLANERVEKAIGLEKTADLDTEALKRRSVAALQGDQALEDLRVKEAGLEAQRQIGIQTLDQLTGADLAAAEAAIAAAEAKERQAIATDKAAKVGATLQDLDRRTAAEKLRTAAVQGSIVAEGDYARAEFIRQEVERAGTNLTAEQVAQLRAKAEVLYAVTAANDNAAFVSQQAEELRLMGLTNHEREVEIRAREIAKQLHAQDNALSDEELKLKSKILALQQVGNEDQARAVSQLGDAVRDEFIKSGHLGFDDVAKYAEEQLRQAIYDTFLKEPIEVLIKAVVSNPDQMLSQISSLFGSAGGGSAGGGSGGLVSNMASSAMAMFSKASPAMAAAIAYQVGSTLATSIVGAFGGDSRQQKNAKNWGGMFGTVGGIIAAVVGGKASNNGAISTLSADSFSLSGSKRNTTTTDMATQASQAILQGEAILKAAGITLKSTVASLDIGTRDATKIVLSDGRALTSAVGDAAAAAEAALKAVIDGASYIDDTQKALVTSMAAAGKSFDDIAAALGQYGVAQQIPQTIADAIQKLADPKAYDVAQLGKDQAARRTQVADAVSKGYLDPTQLAAVNEQLTRLEGLELDAVLKRYGDAVDDATVRLKKAGDLNTSINDGFLKILSPSAYKLETGRREIEDQITAMKTQAEALIATGELTTDVLGRIDALKDLQLNDLISQVAEASDTFAQARKSLTAWIDNLNTSASAELSPQAQRDQAMADYKRVLGLAQGGDATALGQVTTYADRLLSADRGATDNAQSRLALYNQVKADVSALTTMSGGGDVATQIQALGIPLTKLVSISQLTASANDNIVKSLTPALMVTQADIPVLSLMYSQVQAPQTDRVVAAIDQMRADLNAAMAAIKAGQDASSSAVQAALEQVAATAADGLAAVESATLANAGQLSDIRLDNRIVAAKTALRSAVG